MPALLGGVFIGVLSALPIVSIGNCCCCLWIVGGGLLAAYLQQQQHQARPITVLDGARVGVLAGVIGAIVWLTIDSALAPLQTRFIGEIVSARDVPPEVRDWIEMLRDNRVGGRILNFLLMLFGGSAVSTLGGMIGAAYFRNDVPPALGGPIHPPPLP